MSEITLNYYDNKFYLKEKNKKANILATGKFTYYNKTVYLKDGEYHRLEAEGPAIIGKNIQEYFYEGKRHRWNGPAIISTAKVDNANKESYYILDHYFYSAEEFAEIKKLTKLIKNNLSNKWIKIFLSRVEESISLYLQKNYSESLAYVIDIKNLDKNNINTYSNYIELILTIPHQPFSYSTKMKKNRKISSSIKLQNDEFCFIMPFNNCLLNDLKQMNLI